MELKNFVSKKVLIAGIAVLSISLGLALGLTYRSAHGDTRQQDTDIMPQKSITSNYKSTSTSPPTSTSKKKTSVTVLDTSCPVKAETNSKGLKVFYLPNMRGYAKVNATTCFKSAELAAAAGYKSASAK